MAEGTTPPTGQDPAAGQGQDPTTTTTTTTGQEPGMTLEQAQAALREARREAASYRTRAQALEQTQAAADAAKLSDLEKAQRKATELEATLKARDHADLQRAIATEHKLPADLATRLQGTTREELAEDAKALAKLLPSQEQTPGQPTARTTNPARPTAPGAQTYTRAQFSDYAFWAKNRDDMTAALKEGRVVE